MFDEAEIILSQAMDQALRFLSQRFLSSYELRQKMRRKQIPNELIDQVEEKMIYYDYLNDERLSLQFLSHLMKEQKYGTFYIRQKMKMRGLSVPMGIENYNELEAAFKVVDRKFTSYDEDPTLDVPMNKIINTLKNRGFSTSTIRAVCAELYS